MRGYNWLDQQSGMSYLNLDIDVPYEDIYREALPFKKLCENKDYFSDGEKVSEGWSSACIHGHGLNQILSRSAYPSILKGYDKGYRWSKEVIDACPITIDFFKNKFKPYNTYRRIRWMWLEPGAYINSHVDDERRSLAINIAIHQPDECEFRFYKDFDVKKDKDTESKEYVLVPFKNGRAIIIDGGILHSVQNNSNEARLHIQVHGKDISDEYNHIIDRSLDKYIGTNLCDEDTKFKYFSNDDPHYIG